MSKFIQRQIAPIIEAQKSKFPVLALTGPRQSGKTTLLKELFEYQKQNQHQYLHQDHYFWQDSNAHEVDLLTKKGQGFSIFEIKATQTISTSLFKEMDRFEEIAAPTPVNKTLIYGGAENEKRTKYNVVSWKDVSAIFA